MCRLFKGKGKETKLCFMGHVLMENHHGLIITPRLTVATGTAERDTTELLVGDLPGRYRITVESDKVYDTREFVQSLRALNAVPHDLRTAGALLGHRWPHHPPSGVCRQSAIAQAGGGNLWLDQKRGQSQENSSPRNRTGGLDVQPHRRGLQSGSNTQPNGCGFSLNRKGHRKGNPATGDRRSKQPRFISDFAHHSGAEVILK